MILQLYRRQFGEFLILTLLSFIAFVVIYSRLPSLSLPYGDTWDTPVRWVLSYKAHLTKIPGEPLHNVVFDFISSVFAQHNESRKVTVKLLAFFIDPFLPGFGPFWHIFSFVVRALTILVVTFPLFNCLNRRNKIPLRNNFVYLLFYILTGSGLFVYASGPANLWNGLWEVQASFFLGILFAMIAINCFGRIIFQLSSSNATAENRDLQNGRRSFRQSRWLAVPTISLLAGVFSWLSIFSFSGNICIAIVCMGLAAYGYLLKCKEEVGVVDIIRRPEFVWALVSLVLILVSAGSFFNGWISPPHHASMRGGLSLDYIKLFLGNFYQFIISTDSPLYLISFIPVIALGLAAFYFLGKGRQCPEVFLITGSQLIFLLGLACASSIGRSGVNAEYALSPRYNSISILYGYLTLLLIYSSIAAVRVDKALKICSSCCVVVGVLIGVAANLRWYRQIYSHRARLMQSESCFRDFYLSKNPSSNRSAASSDLVCSPAFYPDFDALASWFKTHACSNGQLLVKSENARLICEDQTEF